LRLLVDNQLPLALARHLEVLGWDAVHVSELGMECSSDITIWQYATLHDMVVVTKDQDFQLLSAAQGSIPPQVVWVRLGNCRRTALFEAFRRESVMLRQMLSSGAHLIELR
jgi:predicted nuclease of predicted toxin-antitoxin system